MAELVEEGKVRFIGLSEAGAGHDPPRATRRTRSPRSRASTRSGQRDIEDEVIPTLRELGIGLVAYSPLGRGFLSGRIRSIDDLAEPTTTAATRRASRATTSTRTSRWWSGSRSSPTEKGVTPSQLALAWVLRRGDDIVPIPGTSAAATSRRTWPPSRSSSPTTSGSRSPRRCRSRRGSATREEMMRSVGR